MHKPAIIACVETQQRVVTGEIPQAFHDALTAQKMGLLAAARVSTGSASMTFPTPQTTFHSPITLAEDLGCKYFEAVRVGQNATYSPPQMVGEFLKVMDRMTGECWKSSDRVDTNNCIVVDESTDISILKQLVYYGRAVVEEKLKTLF